MSDEQRKDIPPDSTPEEGRDSWSLDDALPASERPEERLGDELGDTADSVTHELRDLQDELLPPEPADAAVPEPPGWETAEPAGETPVEPAPPALVTPPSPSNYQSSKSSAAFTPEGTDDDRLMSMLAWLSMVILQLPIVSVIQLLSAGTKDRPFQRHHAITSLLFFGAAIVYEILASVVFGILTTVTLGCGAICLWVIFFVPHVLALYYALQAYNGKRVILPFLTDFAKTQGWL